MSRYSRIFTTLLEQDNTTPVPEEPVVTDGEAFEKQLDPGTDPAAFDVKGGVSHRDTIRLEQVEELQNWIIKIEEFRKYMNGVNGDSIQAKLNNAECETLFTEIARAESKRVSRIAQELSSLEESLKGFILRSSDM